jgi:hypothetical protein
VVLPFESIPTSYPTGYIGIARDLATPTPMLRSKVLAGGDELLRISAVTPV